MTTTEEPEFTQDENGNTRIFGLPMLFYFAGMPAGASTCERLVWAGAPLDETFEGQTALFHAATVGATDVCALLMKCRANWRVKSSSGQTPLHSAAASGHADTCHMLVEHGHDVDALSTQGHTPIMYAANGGHAQACQTLIDWGADVDEMRCGVSAMHLAASAGSWLTCQVLLKNGACVDRRNGGGSTPLDDAERAGHTYVVNKLWAHIYKLMDKRDAGSSQQYQRMQLLQVETKNLPVAEPVAV